MSGKRVEACLWDTLFDTIVVPQRWKHFILTRWNKCTTMCPSRGEVWSGKGGTQDEAV